MKTIRLWATTTPEVYKDLMVYLAETVNPRNGSRVKLGTFVEQAVIEKLERENKKLKKLKEKSV